MQKKGFRRIRLFSFIFAVACLLASAYEARFQGGKEYLLLAFFAFVWLGAGYMSHRFLRQAESENHEN